MTGEVSTEFAEFFEFTSSFLMEEYPSSRFSEASLSALCEKYKIPLVYHLRVPKPSKRPNKTFSNTEICIFENYLSMGMSFPFPQELNDFLCSFSFVPAQLAPNSYALFNGVLAFFQENEIPWSVSQFLSFVLVRSTNGICFFQMRTHLPITTCHLPTSHKGWRDGYFFVVSKSAWPCCTTPDFAPQSMFLTNSVSEELEAYVMAWDPNTLTILDFTNVGYLNKFPKQYLMKKDGSRVTAKATPSDTTTLTEVTTKLKKRTREDDPEDEPVVRRRRMMKEKANKMKADIKTCNIPVLAFYEPDGSLHSDSDLDETLHKSKLEYYVGSTNILCQPLSFDGGVSGVADLEKEATPVGGVLSAVVEPSSPQFHELSLSPFQVEETLPGSEDAALAPATTGSLAVAPIVQSDTMGGVPIGIIGSRVKEDMRQAGMKLRYMKEKAHAPFSDPMKSLKVDDFQELVIKEEGSTRVVPPVDSSFLLNNTGSYGLRIAEATRSPADDKLLYKSFNMDVLKMIENQTLGTMHLAFNLYGRLTTALRAKREAEDGLKYAFEAVSSTSSSLNEILKAAEQNYDAAKFQSSLTSRYMDYNAGPQKEKEDLQQQVQPEISLRESVEASLAQSARVIKRFEDSFSSSADLFKEHIAKLQSQLSDKDEEI